MVNGKIYIGQDSKDNPRYLGSGVMIILAISKYGRKNFNKEILCRCLSQKALDNMERYFIKKFNSTNIDIGYNILPGSSNEFGTINPAQIPIVREKIKQSAIQFWLGNYEARRQISLRRKGTKASEYTRQKQSLSSKGKKKTAIHASNISVSVKRAWSSPDTSKELRDSLRIFNNLPTTREKRRLSAKRQWETKRHIMMNAFTKEARAKRRASIKASWNEGKRS